jgi:aminoglycoside/choline kinase family phosphotransferase
VHSNTETREAKRLTWLKRIFDNQSLSVNQVAGDASFRQYYRVKTFNATYILMDAPPEKENSKRFVDIAELMAKYDVPVPQIFHSDFEQGFLLLEDFGDHLFANEVDQDPNHYYRLAIDHIIGLQKVESPKTLPAYDKAFIEVESERFESWFLGKLLNHDLTAEQKASLVSLYELFETIGQHQPSVFVHRDYHSRNLLIPDGKPLGIIDFQDAIHGPITYDLVSLLKDCYVRWPREQVISLVKYYIQQAKVHNLLEQNIDDDTFIRWFDFVGMQRHIKVLGIFARLALRDSKPAYLEDIPRVLNYVEEVIELYPELEFFKPFFNLFNHQFKGSRYA